MLLRLLERGIYVINLHLFYLDVKLVLKGALFAGGLENGLHRFL